MRTKAIDIAGRISLAVIGTVGVAFAVLIGYLYGPRIGKPR